MNSQRTAELSQDLIDSIDREKAKLASLPEAEAESRLGGGHGWSRKQEIGHLIDSSTNNRVRFATAALQGEYSGPSYDGEVWVKLGNYASMPWETLISLWTAQNRALAALIAQIPDEKLTASCHIGSGSAVTLGFLIEDYILHMQHHLDHLLGRDASTSYPGANQGV